MKYAFILVVLMLPMAAYAQKVSADFSTGSVIVGPDTRACVVGLAGALRYNASTDQIEYCNGTTWAALGS